METRVMALVLVVCLGTLAAVGAEEQSSAPAPVAFVLSCRGVTEYRVAEDTDFETLNPGTWLEARAFIRTGADGRVVLQYSDNAVVRVEANQGYQVGSRTAQDRPQTTGFWAAVNRMVNQVTGDRPAVAGVRGFEPSKACVEPRVAFVPRGGDVIGFKLDLRWAGGMPDVPFTVTVTDTQGAIIIEQETAQRHLEINLSNIPAVRGQTYTWSVRQPKVANLAPAIGKFYWVALPKEQELRDAIREWSEKNTEGLDEDARRASLALFYIGNGLYAEADKELIAAIGAAKDPAIYAPLRKALYTIENP